MVPNDASAAISDATTTELILSSASPPRLLGHVGGEQAQLAGAAQQATRDAPVLAFERLTHRRHFLAHEVGRGARDQPVLVGETLRRQDVTGRGVLDQPRAALLCQCHRRHHDILSKIPAAPMPPPTHMLTSP